MVTTKTTQQGGRPAGQRGGGPGRGGAQRGGFGKKRGKFVRRPRVQEFDAEAWTPKTRLGRDVKEGRIASFDEIVAKGRRIMEQEIVDFFFPELEIDFAMIGQAKGKFGGGQRRVYKHTQKKIREGARMKFSYIALVGNNDGYIGVGKGSSRQSFSAKEKAMKAAKLALTKILRGCGSWECGCAKAHSVPFELEGKCGSVRLRLIPAPRGTGLITQSEVKKILRLAGISDAWAQSLGETRSGINLAYATFDALQKSSRISITTEFAEEWGVK